jgi:hypothetical protein
MLLRRSLTWTALIVLLITTFFTAHVQAKTTQPQEENQSLDSTTVFLPLVIKPGGGNLPPPTLTNIIDHTTLPLYDQIPSQYLRAAENITFTFVDRSVGSNIYDGLGCLASPTWGSSLSACRRHYVDASLTTWKTFTTNDSIIPEVIRFPGGNNRSNIEFIFQQGTWEDDLRWFVNNYPAYTHRDIFSLQHNYLHVGSGSTIAQHYFNPSYPGTNIYDVLALEAQYSDKIFVYWTSSLARTIGTPESQSFNSQMRTWARDNNKILIDVAAILSHTPEGNPCVNNQGYQIICREYTTESDGGHLGSVSGGKIRVAKAIWILLAQLAGWQG